MSFFDDPCFFNPNTFELCKTIRSASELNSKKKVLFEGELILRPAPGLMTTKYFKLFDRKLVYYSSKNSSNAKGYYDLMNFLKLIAIDAYDIIGKKALPAFRLEKFGKFHEFSNKDPNQVKSWIRVLRLYCVSNDFECIYERNSLLGKGHFAKVFKVKSLENGLNFAAKIMSKDRKFEQQKTYVFNEVKILKALPKHENIIKLYEVYESILELVLIFEYVEGGDLYQLIKKSKITPISTDTLAKIFSQMVKGLMFLHSKNIMHRDIKPENILLSDNTDFHEVKIADFSLAEEIAHEEICVKCGTPGYMAPEVFLSKAYDERIDIYSLGIVLFMMLTKKSPFKGKDAKEILSKNKLNNILYKKSDWINLDESLRRLVYDLTSKEPKDRPSLVKVSNHNWLKPFFKEGGIDSMENKNPILKHHEVKSLHKYSNESEKLNSNTIKSKGTLKVISQANSSASLNLYNFNLNSVNSLFIGTNGTSENSLCLMSPGIRSFNSIMNMESPKCKEKNRVSAFDLRDKEQEFTLSLNKIKKKQDEEEKKYSQTQTSTKNVVSATENASRQIFLDENPVANFMKKLKNLECKIKPTKNLHF